MAIYEYNCQSCGNQFQARRPMKEADAPIDCPACGSGEAKRGLSLFFAASNGGGALKGAGGGSSCSSCGGGSCASCGGH